MLDIKKNRFDGEIGKVAFLFNNESRRYECMNTQDVEMITSGKPPKEVL